MMHHYYRRRRKKSRRKKSRRIDLAMKSRNKARFDFDIISAGISKKIEYYEYDTIEQAREIIHYINTSYNDAVNRLEVEEKKLDEAYKPLKKKKGVTK